MAKQAAALTKGQEAYCAAVSALLLVTDQTEGVREMLFSLCAQNHRLAEIVVIYDGDRSAPNWNILQGFGDTLQLHCVHDRLLAKFEKGLSLIKGQYVLCMCDAVVLETYSLATALEWIKGFRKRVYAFTAFDGNQAPFLGISGMSGGTAAGFESECDISKNASVYADKDGLRFAFEKIIDAGSFALLADRKSIAAFPKSDLASNCMFLPSMLMHALNAQYTVAVQSEQDAYGHAADVLRKQHDEKNGDLLQADSDFARLLKETSKVTSIRLEYDLLQIKSFLNDLLKKGRVFTFAALCHIVARQHYEGKQREKLCTAIADVLHVESSHVSSLLDCALSATGRKKVAFYENVWNLGGIERVISILLPHLCDEFDLVLITGKPGKKAKGFPVPENVLHTYAPFTSDFPLHVQIALVLALADADVLVGNPNIAEDFLPIYECLQNTSIKTIACNHYFYYLPYQFSWPWLRKLAQLRVKPMQAADVLTWPTSFSTVLSSGLNPCAICIPNPNTYDSMPEHEQPQKKIILAVGRFDDVVKRIDRTFIMFQHVLKHDPDAQLWVVGEYNGAVAMPATNSRSLDLFIGDLGIPKGAIRFLGNQPDVLPFYKQASLLILTSECEGYGMVLKEAGVAGLPVIVNNFPGVSDIIADGVNGYCIDCSGGQYEDAAQKIHQLLNDTKLYKRFSVAAQEKAAETTAELIAQKWKQIIQTTITYDDPERRLEEFKRYSLVPDEKQETEMRLQAINFLEKLEESRKIEDETAAAVVERIAQEGASSGDAVILAQELQNMQQTISWRITKPLRIATRFRRSLKQIGIKETIRKIIRKLKSRLHR